MQTLVHQDVTRIDISLDPDHVYQTGLCASRRPARHPGFIVCHPQSPPGELRATEHVDLPLQAAGYWSASAGTNPKATSPATAISPDSTSSPSRRSSTSLPRPALSSHTDVLQRYLSRDMEIIRVGLAESWRRGLRVMFRQ
jgi:hypothetical protein